MRFKILTAHSASDVKDEIERFKYFCGEWRIKDIRIVGQGSTWVITIIYERWEHKLTCIVV